MVFSKRIVPFFVIFVIVVSMAAVPAFSESNAYHYEEEAYLLHNLGLFDGISTETFDPDLESPVNRETGIAFIVKMFGKKEYALKLSDGEIRSALIKFTDRNEITDWAKPYIAYAVMTGMVTGDTDTTVSPKILIDAKSFATLILRNLGYTVDAAGWKIAMFTLSGIGGMPSPDVVEFNKPYLIRDDIAGIVYNSLFARNISSVPLIEMLISENVVEKDKAINAGLVNNDGSLNTGDGQVDTETEEVYDLIKEALLKGEEEVLIPKYTISDTGNEVFEIINSVIIENPLIMYYNGCSYWTDGRLVLNYKKEPEEVCSHIKASKEKAYSILVDIIKPGMTDYEKEISVHDYIINHCAYDYKNFSMNTLPPEAFTPYGILVSGSGVCEGYSTSMKLMMDILGIECGIVHGIANLGSHSWNIIKIGGSCYYLDITWDDPVMQDESNFLRYDYFNITGEEVTAEHQLDLDKYPECTATKYNYYYYNNLIIESSDELYTILTNVIKNNDPTALSYKAAGFSLSKEHIEQLIQQAYKNTSAEYTQYSFIYSLNEILNIISIWYE